jgi:hypothetical protein
MLRIRQIERSHVADKRFAAVIQHASQSSFNIARAIIRKPRQERRLLMSWGA